VTTTTRGSRKTKKPKWSTLTYTRIESRRKKLGISKAAMAAALGVTNSTYHNWRRGTTVPHPNQQALLKTKMEAIGDEKAPAAPTVDNGARNGARNGNGRRFTGRGVAFAQDRQTPGVGEADARDTHGGSQCSAHLIHRESPIPLVSVSSVPGIAAITVAFIESQKKPPSAGSVVSFVGDLRSALNA
jgi:DNA-binding XRE family transcriptional regulator